MAQEILTNKDRCLAAAVEIAKAYGSGGSGLYPDVLIEAAYKKLVELMRQAQQGD